MASRSLGTLTLDLIAKIGGFESGMDRAARTADRKGKEIAAAQRRAAKEAEEAWSKVGSVIGGVFAGISGGVVFQKFIAETKAAEQEQAQLEAVLKSTGNAAGFSQGRLNEMAETMSDVLGISGGEINQAQTVLLAFTNIVGDKLPAALQAAADHSARTGSEIKASAEIMGRALDVPSVGMASLQKQGFKFSESQIEVAREMERTGRIAEAQQMVLDSLNESYGGAAAAARDTLGGALKALQGSINSLMTGEGGSVEEMTKSINTFTNTLSSEQTRAAFSTFTSWMANLADTAVKTAALLNQGSFWGWLQVGKKDSEDVGAAIADTEKKIASLQETVASMSRPLHRFWNGDDIVIANGQISTLQAKLKTLYAMQDQAHPPVRALNPAALAPDLPARVVGAVNLKDGKDGKEKKDPNENAARTYIQQLNDQIGKLNELTAVEKVLYDLQLGKVKLTHAQKDVALGLAEEIDSQKRLNEQKKSDLELTVAQINAQREFNAEMDRYARQLAGMGMGSAARDKAAGMAQISDKYDAEYKRLEDRKRQAVYDDKWTAQAEERYAKELLMLEGFQAKAVESYTSYYDQLKAKEGSMWLGASEAMANYASESANLFAQTEDAMTKAFRGMEDALVNFVSTGKLDFKSLADSIIADLVRIQVKAAISGIMKFLTPIISAAAGDALGMSIGGTYGASTQAGLDNLISSKGWSSGGYTGSGGKYQPAGLVHKGEGVLSQEDMSALGGPGGFAALRRSLRNGFSDGGLVGSIPAIARGGGGGGGNSDMQLTIVNQTSGRIDNVQEQRISQTERALIISEAVDAAWSQPSNPNSKASKTLNSAYGLRRTR